MRIEAGKIGKKRCGAMKRGGEGVVARGNKAKLLYKGREAGERWRKMRKVEARRGGEEVRLEGEDKGC